MDLESFAVAKVISEFKLLLVVFNFITLELKIPLRSVEDCLEVIVNKRVTLCLSYLSLQLYDG